MKRSLLAAAVLALTVAGTASAATYQTTCIGAACVPFNQTNSFVQQLAVNLAASNSAPVGSTIEVWYVPASGRCEERILIWTVNRVPTLNSSHLTFNQGLCLVAGQ